MTMFSHSLQLHCDWSVAAFNCQAFVLCTAVLNSSKYIIIVCNSVVLQSKTSNVIRQTPLLFQPGPPGVSIFSHAGQNHKTDYSSFYLMAQNISAL